MRGDIVESIEIAASADRVFRALTTPSDLMMWWSDPGTYPAVEWSLDARPGGKWLSRWQDPEGNEFSLGGEVLEVNAPHLLVYSWWDTRFPGLPHTTVRYDIAETRNGVCVRVTHSGFDDVRADFDDYNGGWSNVLTKLHKFAMAGAQFRANRDVAIEVGVRHST